MVLLCCLLFRLCVFRCVSFCCCVGGFDVRLCCLRVNVSVCVYGVIMLCLCLFMFLFSRMIRVVDCVFGVLCFAVVDVVVLVCVGVVSC